MSLAGLILGVINILIVVAVLILVGLIIAWVLGGLGWPVPEQVKKVYLAIVALVALYMFVALLLGMPTLRVIGHQSDIKPGGWIEPPRTQVLKSG